ncbi:hypothetical protein O3M35_009602 [Rhynocoris fuscipes]|uniref:Peptidase M24 domain-containing protein n=1 Tax=Rhynocoris fuscipes TaxID=488301 RepID=A0AAW1D4C9_9HEMI
MVPKDRLKTGESPLINMKAVKNEIEVEGARKAHIRDSVALCALFKKMEEEIPNGIQWDELKVAEVLDQFRKDYGENLYRGPSFKTIAAFGAHAALPHYVSSPDTNIAVDTSAAMTLDSGGQYLDGTIDTTRVLHFGNPTNFEIDIYTSLLQGVIDLADTVFPAAVPVSSLEILIRRPLFKLGLTFTHGITHGTGIFSNVHEDFNRTYFENFIGSQEPGYYLKDKLGMRLENLVVVVKAPVQNEANPAPLLTFSPLTLVPYELKLTNVSKLDFREISWLNNYHATVLEVVGNEMIKKGYQELYKWLEVKTKSVKKVCE